MAPSSADRITLDLIKSLSKFTKQSPFVTFVTESGHYAFQFPAKSTSHVADWYADDNFGASRIDKLGPNLEYFRTLKVLGTGDFATVNKAFFDRFREISTDLRKKVDKALKEKGKRKIVFTGHSNGGAIAILATVWFLEQYRQSEITPLCITYGAPLVGDKIFGHALRREQLLHETDKSWASCFINVVSIRDLAPRILLSPLKDLQPYLQSVFQTWEKKKIENTSANTELCEDFFTRLMNDVFAVASYDSCVLRSSAGGSSLLEAVKDLVELSPYRPFGSFHFCVDKEKTLLRVDNHDAVLQILFYSLQLEGEGSNVHTFVQGSVEAHMSYETSVKALDAILPLANLNQLPLSPQTNVNPAFEALGLGTEARLSLRAAGEMEAERFSNLKRVEAHKQPIRDCLKRLSEYRAACAGETGYYDAFKLQQHERDFRANVDRLELVGYWEEVREWLKVFELPDSFEVKREWVELGTEIRFLVEPIDIANFYRHRKKDQTGAYDAKSRARPNYYKYPQNWLEHMRTFVPADDRLRKEVEWHLDSCFWARVENLCGDLSGDSYEQTGFQSLERAVSDLEKEVFEWLNNGGLKEAVLAKSRTFRKWWDLLPPSHREKAEPHISRIRDLMNREPSPAI